MGLFDFLRSPPATPPAAPDPADANRYLLGQLAEKLGALGHAVKFSAQHLALTVNGELEIATAIIESPDYHPSLLHLLILTIQPTYFPDGITENIVGVGTTLAAKVDSVLDNYLSTTFPPIMASFSDTHDPALDYTDNAGTLWHPKTGDIGLQGQWPTRQLAGEPLLDLLQEPLRAIALRQKLNWLKLYIARQADGSLSGECLLNNQPWAEGYAALKQYAAQWAPCDGFQGQKQFIMLRRCDAYDAAAS